MKILSILSAASEPDRMKINFLATICFLLCQTAFAAPYPFYYEIGNVSVQDLYVDPVSGKDSNDGLSKSSALKSLTAAWNSIPRKRNLTTGVRINILPGTIPESAIPNYMEERYGTANSPIIIQSLEGKNSTILAGDLNVFDVRYLYLINLTIRPDGDTFHCEKCDHILLRGSEFDGGEQLAQETIKFNQSSNVFIEASDIHGAADNAIDFVAVQHGHVIGNTIHDAADWCQYAKGGSAYLRIEANRYFNCGTGGFTAGQGTGLEFMTSPWIHYEAYDLKFINNIIHDTEGAGFGVNGGYNILFAYNTLFRIGERSHLIEAVFGKRSCDGDNQTCQNYLNQGGWGVSTQDIEQSIPNKNVIIANNLVYNPQGYTSGYQHFAVHDAESSLPGSNLPDTIYADENLLIKGNLIKNGPDDWPLGIDGCNNSSCNASQLNQENFINTAEPQFENTANNDFRPLDSGFAAISIPDFSGTDRISPPLAETGDLNNLVRYDRSGSLRSEKDIIGAYIAGSKIDVPLPPGANPADKPKTKASLKISKISKKLISAGKTKIIITLSAKSADPFKLSASLQNKKKLSVKKTAVKKISNDKYTSTLNLNAGSYLYSATLKDAAGSSSSINKTFKVKNSR